MKKLSLFVAGLLGVVALAWAGYPYYAQTWNGTGTRRNTVEFSIQTPSAGAAAIFAPGTTDTNALGSTSLRFSNVFTTLLNVSGATTLTGAITASGGIVASAPTRIPTLDVTVSSPSANIGDLCVTSAGLVYVSTNTAGIISSWLKVGAQ